MLTFLIGALTGAVVVVVLTWGWAIWYFRDTWR